MPKTRNENWSSILFCPEVQGCSVNCDNVAALLTANLFANDPKVKRLFVERYRQMRENYSDNTRADGKGVPHDDERWDLKLGTETFERDGADKAALLSVPQCALPGFPPRVAALWNHANFGLDMPTWMVKSGVENPRRVMIVATEPRRTGHPAGNLLLSTPFGFHSEDYREIGCKNDAVYDLVWRLLDKGDCVYLTDCLKFYTDDGTDGRKENFVTSNLKCKLRYWENVFLPTLKAEIRAFDPDVILGLGRAFFEKVLNFNGVPKQKVNFTDFACPNPYIGTVWVEGKDKGIPAISCIHPSGENRQYPKKICEARPNMTREDALLDYYTNWQ